MLSRRVAPRVVALILATAPPAAAQTVTPKPPTPRSAGAVYGGLLLTLQSNNKCRWGSDA